MIRCWVASLWEHTIGVVPFYGQRQMISFCRHYFSLNNRGGSNVQVSSHIYESRNIIIINNKKYTPAKNTISICIWHEGNNILCFIRVRQLPLSFFYANLFRNQLGWKLPTWRSNALHMFHPQGTFCKKHLSPLCLKTFPGLTMLRTTIQTMKSND